jgi:hypothetical protein
MEVHHHSHHPKKWKEYLTELGRAPAFDELIAKLFDI